MRTSSTDTRLYFIRGFDSLGHDCSWTQEVGFGRAVEVAKASMLRNPTIQRVSVIRGGATVWTQLRSEWPEHDYMDPRDHAEWEGGLTE